MMQKATTFSGRTLFQGLRRMVGLVVLAAPLAAQVVVVAPPPPINDDSLRATDPYGPCLPDLRPGATGCKPNYNYKPDYTVGVINPAAVYQQNAAANQTSEMQAALAKLAAEVETLRLQQLGRDLSAAASAQQQDAQRSALARVIQAQNSLEAQYRATWPRWVEHWNKTGPTITTAALALVTATDAGSPTRGCGAFVAFNGELKVALPPAPGNIIGGLHAGLYELWRQCLDDPANGDAVRAKAERLRGEVEMLSEWAQGRSAYYAAAP